MGNFITTFLVSSLTWRPALRLVTIQHWQWLLHWQSPVWSFILATPTTDATFSHVGCRIARTHSLLVPRILTDTQLWEVTATQLAMGQVASYFRRVCCSSLALASRAVTTDELVSINNWSMIGGTSFLLWTFGNQLLLCTENTHLKQRVAWNHHSSVRMMISKRYWLNWMNQ